VLDRLGQENRDVDAYIVDRIEAGLDMLKGCQSKKQRQQLYRVSTLKSMQHAL
jgi:hypothetical protein